MPWCDLLGFSTACGCGSTNERISGKEIFYWNFFIYPSNCVEYRREFFFVSHVCTYGNFD